MELNEIKEKEDTYENKINDYFLKIVLGTRLEETLLLLKTYSSNDFRGWGGVQRLINSLRITSY